MKNNATLTNSSRHDTDLLKAAISGDAIAFNQFMGSYKEALSSMIIRMINNKEETEVLTEKICKIAYTNIHQYNPEITFCGWLFRIASESAISHLRDRLKKMPNHSDLNKNGSKTVINLNRHINGTTNTKNHKSLISNNSASEIKIEEFYNNNVGQK